MFAHYEYGKTGSTKYCGSEYVIKSALPWIFRRGVVHYNRLANTIKKDGAVALRQRIVLMVKLVAYAITRWFAHCWRLAEAEDSRGAVIQDLSAVMVRLWNEAGKEVKMTIQASERGWSTTIDRLLSRRRCARNK